MGTHICYAIAFLFLVFGNVELYERHAQLYYERPETSSPAPIDNQSPDLTGMKELVLFLTPDQVKTLVAAGAVVQPVPEYEAEFAELQQKLKESNKEKGESLYSSIPQGEEQKQESELESYYKLLNIHEINEDLSQQPTTEATTETISSTPRYKYTKSRQQNKEKPLFTPYVPKKSSRTKASNQNTNTEYVRFLPNYENENLKMAPYQAIPLLPYVYEAHGKFYTHEKLQLAPQEASRENVFRQVNSQSQPEEVKPVVEEEPEKPEAIVEVPAPALRQKAEKSQTKLRAQDLQGYREALATIKGLAPLQPQQEKEVAQAPVQPTTQTPVVKEEQSSRLLAPLYQHQSITDTIAAQKASLLNSELEIYGKLQEIRESPLHDDEKYTKEISKLNSNLEKQNHLSKIEALSKSTVLNSQDETKRRPIEIVKQTEPQGIQVPTLPIPESESGEPVPQAVPLTVIRPASIPTVHTVKVEKTVSVKESPLLSKNLYLHLDNAQGAPKVPEVAKPSLPIKLFYRPEKLTITRHIWEH